MTAPTIQQIYEQAVGQFRAGHLDAARALYLRVLQMQPDHADALNMLGVLMHQGGDSDRAVGLIGSAVELDPGNAGYRCNLGIALARQGEIDRAIEEFGVAIRLKPDSAQAHNNLANLLRRRGRIDEAIEHYGRALAIDPRYAMALANLGNAQMDVGEVDEAIASYRRAEAMGSSVAAGSLLYALHFHPQSTPYTLRDEHARWNRRYALPLAPIHSEFPNDVDRDRPIRIGYVSPDFRLHPVGRFLLPLFEHHNRGRFEVYCFSDVHRPDAMTERLKRDVHAWRETAAMGDEQVAALIREGRIDVLIDLTMHMAGNRLGVFARKPAPVQMTYLAYCSTTGLGTMDYRFTDRFLDPEGSAGRDESVYTEKSVRLPAGYWCYAPWPDSPEVAGPPMLTAGYVTFGCLNNFCKASDFALRTWREMMRELPGSRLILHAHEGWNRQRVREFFSGGGVEANRVEFVGSAPLVEYLKSHRRIDIGLDPFPYGGGTTTCDALWMGVPVVSLAGETAVSRSGLSILSQVGLSELVGGDQSEYFRIGVMLARDPDRLVALRSGLRERMLSSPLMDAVQFTRSVEDAYRQMWETWARSRLTA